MTESNSELPDQNKKSKGKESKGYPREFFDIQIKLARKLSEISGRPINDVLLNNTNLYKRLIGGGKPDSSNPFWQEFISGIEEQDLTNYTYQFYLRFKDRRIQTDKERLTFGFFRYDYDPDSKIVHIHFDPKQTPGSPLGDTEKRRQELRQMFEYIKKNHPDMEKVKGGSWLYNVKKYRDIFPPEYTSNLGEYDSKYQGFSIWGQFLDRNTEIRPEKVKEFIESLDGAKNEEEILQAFPLRPLSASTSITNFYNFLGIN
ncbi:MAG: hypothetical protein WAW92_01310 [Minisyncoccia bacterium]